MKTTRLAILAFILSTHLSAHAEIPVEVDHSGDDIVGQMLIYQVKENIRASLAFKITFEDVPRIKISIITLDGYNVLPGTISLYSVTWLWTNKNQIFPFYLTSFSGYCGANQVNNCAKFVIAKTDEQAELIIKLLKAGMSNQIE